VIEEYRREKRRKRNQIEEKKEEDGDDRRQLVYGEGKKKTLGANRMRIGGWEDRWDGDGDVDHASVDKG
jgi:hypothetical protein